MSVGNAVAHTRLGRKMGKYGKCCAFNFTNSQIVGIWNLQTTNENRTKRISYNNEYEESTKILCISRIIRIIFLSFFRSFVRSLLLLFCSLSGWILETRSYVFPCSYTAVFALLNYLCRCFGLHYSIFRIWRRGKLVACAQSQYARAGTIHSFITTSWRARFLFRGKWFDYAPHENVYSFTFIIIICTFFFFLILYSKINFT